MTVFRASLSLVFAGAAFILVASSRASAEDQKPGGTPSEPRTYSSLSPEDGWASPVADDETFSFFLAEILEYRLSEDGGEGRWDTYGWRGGDYNRVWVKSEGGVSGGEGQADFQLAYGRLVSQYFDFQAGIRYEQLWGEDSDQSRVLASIGLQGLARYFFEAEPTLFVSPEGDISGRFTGAFDLLLTQRLILQPRFEAEVAVQDQEKFGMGSGLNDIDVGLRLRYEISREFAPYVGVNFRELYGETARYARESGEDTLQWSFVTGVRMWF
jgi:copper resistance protein B